MGLVLKDVVVIGGGFCGTVLAVQLMRRAPSLSVAVIEKSSLRSRGLAYSTEHECHLLNVSAGNMSAFPAEPEHFLNWAKKNCVLPVHPRSYLPRSLYGRYLNSLLETELDASANFRWICGEVLSLHRAREGFVVLQKNGSAVLTRAVVLAMGNFPPGNLNIPGLSESSRCYVRQPWAKNTLSDLSEQSDVLLIGSGLTAVDIAIALRARGFKGKIHVLSRHGLLPQFHATPSNTPWPRFWSNHSPRTVRGLLRLIREQVRSASAAGSDWRAVMDSLRPLIQQIWKSLPSEEQRRFLRHVRAYWEVHRHRVAPDVGNTFSDMIGSRQVQTHAGRITGYSEKDNLAEVTFRNRKTGAIQTLRVARVINCSGPETNCRKVDSDLLDSLFTQRLIRQDSLALGLDMDRNGALLNRDGVPSENFYAIGSLRKGLLWESTAVPELRVQAADLANHLLNKKFQQDARSGQTESLAVT